MSFNVSGVGAKIIENLSPDNGEKLLPAVAKMEAKVNAAAARGADPSQAVQDFLQSLNDTGMVSAKDLKVFEGIGEVLIAASTNFAALAGPSPLETLTKIADKLNAFGREGAEIWRPAVIDGFRATGSDGAPKLEIYFRWLTKPEMVPGALEKIGAKIKEFIADDPSLSGLKKLDLGSMLTERPSVLESVATKPAAPKDLGTTSFEL